MPFPVKRETANEPRSPDSIQAGFRQEDIANLQLSFIISRISKKGTLQPVMD